VALVGDAVQIGETWDSGVACHLEVEKRVGWASHNNLVDNLAEPLSRKGQDTEQAAVETQDNMDLEGAKKYRRRHNDMQGNICMVCIVPHLQVEGCQVLLTILRLRRELTDNNPGHLRSYVARGGNIRKHPEEALGSTASQDRPQGRGDILAVAEASRPSFCSANCEGVAKWLDPMCTVVDGRSLSCSWDRHLRKAWIMIRLQRYMQRYVKCSPRSKSTLTTSRWPFLTASMRGVTPVWSE